MRLVNSYAAQLISTALRIRASSPQLFLKSAVSPKTQITQNQILVSVLMHVLETFSRSLEEAFLLLLLLHPKSFYTKSKTSEKNGSSIGKKFVIILQQPFNHCRPMSRIADRNLLKNFNTRKKCVFTIITTPTSQRF